MNNTMRIPTFKRQKFLLSFIKGSGGVLSPIELQKLVFLYHQKTETAFYDFVPYLYGCYSFQVAQDVDTLQSMGWLKVKNDEISLLESYVPTEKTDLLPSQFFDEYKSLRGESLIQKVYREYPYFAINSRIAKNILNPQELNRVQEKQTSLKQAETVLFTIGYEGISLEKYLNTLIQNDVRLLCDVRNNPLSRKFGFSKQILKHALSKVNIEYLHRPELGIISEKRKTLAKASDYRQIFSEYGHQLPSLSDSVSSVYTLLKDKQRIALTCFEHDPQFCHRHVLSDFMQAEFDLEVIHL